MCMFTAREHHLNPPEVFEMKKAAGDITYSPDKVADMILSGLKKNSYHLPSPDLMQTLSQSTMASLTPYPLWTPVQMLVSALTVPVTLYFTSLFDRIARKHCKKPEAIKREKDS